ncbi:MAG: ROK family protein [Nitriliruptorales bacterium]
MGARKAVLAADLGGSTLVGAVVTTRGDVRSPVRLLPVAEGGETSAVADQLAGLLADLRRDAADAGEVPVGAGVGVPGPFDYDHGVSHMQHKLRGLHGVALRPPLEAAAGAPVRFCNDAVAFALGAQWREHPEELRLVGITLGTGVGAGFVIDGRPAREGEGVPAGGEIWNLPYGAGILEDAVSGRSIERGFEERTGVRRGVDAIAELAREGDEAALAAFAAFGGALGEGLALAIADFAPSRIVCGGQIAKAFDLFGGNVTAAYAAAAREPAAIDPATADDLALSGAARCVLHAAGHRPTAPKG